jgi:hypothetical protein
MSISFIEWPMAGSTPGATSLSGDASGNNHHPHASRLRICFYGDSMYEEPAPGGLDSI